MEAPSSTRSFDGPHAAAADFRDHKHARAALLDITNDSPIVGLAFGSLPPVKGLVSVSKGRVRTTSTTYGSGEEVLRGQVRTLLQKVEEDEPELASPSSSTRHALIGLARTQLDGPEDNDLKTILPKQVEPISPREFLINRALMFDSPEKSISAEVEEASGGDGDLLGDLCEGMRKMSMMDDREKPVRLPEFTGKHTRFIYNSDDEMEGEEMVNDEESVSPGVLVLKGLPAPEGKHLRFREEEDEEDCALKTDLFDF